MTKLTVWKIHEKIRQTRINKIFLIFCLSPLRGIYSILETKVKLTYAKLAQWNSNKTCPGCTRGRPKFFYYDYISVCTPVPYWTVLLSKKTIPITQPHPLYSHNTSIRITICKYIPWKETGIRINYVKH